MRSDTVKRGDHRAPHRSLLRAIGLKDEDFDKPFIAICCSHCEIVPGHVHLDKVAAFVKQCVWEAGGVPFIFHTIAVDDGIAMGHTGMKFSLPSRDLIADCVETMIQAHCFDGMICIPNCDKIVPGMLLGAVRCNIPTIFVSGGPMEAGKTSSGQTVDLISVFIGAAAKQKGKLSAEELYEIECSACPTCGSCSGLFTANSMNCLCEALGLALPMNGTLLATSAERKAPVPMGGAADRTDGLRLRATGTRSWHPAAGNRYPKVDRQRLYFGYGHRRQYQHGAAYAGSGQRGRSTLHDGPNRRTRPTGSQPLQGSS